MCTPVHHEQTVRPRYGHTGILGANSQACTTSVYRYTMSKQSQPRLPLVALLLRLFRVQKLPLRAFSDKNG